MMGQSAYQEVASWVAWQSGEAGDDGLRKGDKEGKGPMLLTSMNELELWILAIKDLG
jgi:hypothetical protein